MFKLLFIPILLLAIIFPTQLFARITPEDLINSQKDLYNQKARNYSPANQQKLSLFSQKIAELNKQITDDYAANIQRQADILDEYVKRNNISENGGKDGIHRNLSGGVENARYWLTYAHEAVAYQAAKVYIFNLTSESNINSDISSQINSLQYDISILKGKVEKSQQIISTLVSK